MSNVNSGNGAASVHVPVRIHLPPPPPGSASKLLEGLLSMSNLPAPAKWAASIAPGLATPGFDIESLNAKLGELDGAITREQVKTGTETIKLNDAERAAVAAKVKEQLETALKKAEEAKAAASEGNVAGWCTAIFGLIGAVVGVVAALAATGLTAGAGAVVLALAVTGAILAVQDVVAMSLKEAKVMDADGKPLDVSMNGVVDMVIEDQLKNGSIVEVEKRADGKWVNKRNPSEVIDPEESTPWRQVKTTDELASYRSDVKLGVTVSIAVTMLVGGGAGVGLSKWGKVVDVVDGAVRAAKDASKLEKVAQAAGIVMDAAQGASSIAHATIGIEVAELDRDSDRARANKAYYEAMMQDIAKRMGLAQDAIRELVSRFNENYDRMSSTIAAMSSTSAKIGRNIAGGA